jgi:hypothetical protein
VQRRVAPSDRSRRQTEGASVGGRGRCFRRPTSPTTTSSHHAPRLSPAAWQSSLARVGFVSSFLRTCAGFFLPTDIFIPLPSGKSILQRYKWYTTIYRSNSKSKPKWSIQMVRRGIPRYKLFIPLRYELKPLRIA